VVSGADLKTWFATTSPFCTLQLQPNGPSHRTRVLSEPGDSPTWDEEFRFALNGVTDPTATMAFQVFDSDIMSHDFMAGGTLELMTVVQAEGTTIENYVPLRDGGGTQCGFLRVLVSYARPKVLTNPYTPTPVKRQITAPEEFSEPIPMVEGTQPGPRIRNPAWSGPVDNTAQLAAQVEPRTQFDTMPPSTSPRGDFRAPWTYSPTADAAKAAAAQRIAEDRAYLEATVRRAAQGEARKKAAAEVAKRMAEEQERRRRVEELQKAVMKHSSEMTITKGNHPDYPAGHAENEWVRQGNYMVANSVKWFSVSGTARLQQGVYKVVWQMRVEKTAQMDTLKMEVCLPSTGIKLFRDWDILEISRASGQGFMDIELGTIRVETAEEPHASFRLWNHSIKVKQGVTIGAIRFQPQ